MKFINTIPAEDVFYFKEAYCDENIKISNLLGHPLNPYLKPPILDVGAGTGDIAYRALEHKKVIMIDVNQLSKQDYPCRPLHVRKQADFFDFESAEPINTLLISHTLQFIDSDTVRLNGKISELNPETIVLVINANDDFMAELIDWTNTHFDNPNPEVRLNNFPEGYNLIKSKSFTAKLQCPDFETLARQVSYLMLIEPGHLTENLVSFLKGKLAAPLFSIHQIIEIYQRQ